jgi:restriction endonuclease Mrr
VGYYLRRELGPQADSLSRDELQVVAVDALAVQARLAHDALSMAEQTTIPPEFQRTDQRIIRSKDTLERLDSESEEELRATLDENFASFPAERLEELAEGALVMQEQLARDVLLLAKETGIKGVRKSDERLIRARERAERLA